SEQLRSRPACPGRTDRGEQKLKQCYPPDRQSVQNGHFLRGPPCGVLLLAESLASSPCLAAGQHVPNPAWVGIAILACFARRRSSWRTPNSTARRAAMKSTVSKRSIVFAGRRTSVSLEDAFWSGLKEIARGRGATVSDLVAMIDADRQHANLSSAVRLFVLGF